MEPDYVICANMDPCLRSLLDFTMTILQLFYSCWHKMEYDLTLLLPAILDMDLAPTYNDNWEKEQFYVGSIMHLDHSMSFWLPESLQNKKGCFCVFKYFTVPCSKQIRTPK